MHKWTGRTTNFYDPFDLKKVKKCPNLEVFYFEWIDYQKNLGSHLPPQKGDDGDAKHFVST